MKVYALNVIPTDRTFSIEVCAGVYSSPFTAKIMAKKIFNADNELEWDKANIDNIEISSNDEYTFVITTFELE